MGRSSGFDDRASTDRSSHVTRRLGIPRRRRARSTRSAWRHAQGRRARLRGGGARPGDSAAGGRPLGQWRFLRWLSPRWLRSRWPAVGWSFAGWPRRRAVGHGPDADGAWRRARGFSHRRDGEAAGSPGSGAIPRSRSRNWPDRFDACPGRERFRRRPPRGRVRPASPTSLFVLGVAPGRTTIAAIDDNGAAIAEDHVTVRPSGYVATQVESAIDRLIAGHRVHVITQPNGVVVTGAVAVAADADLAIRPRANSWPLGKTWKAASPWMAASR